MTATQTVAHAHEALRGDHRRLHSLVDRLGAAAVRDMRDRARRSLGGAHDSLVGEAGRLAQVLAEHEKREHAMVDAAMARGA